MPYAVAPFELTTFEEDAPYLIDKEVRHARAHLAKTFHGDLEATSTVEMLSVRNGQDGVGYVAIERVTGSLAGRSGSFAIAHISTMSGGEYWAKWPIVPGSGTEGLEKIVGETRIEIAPDGAHTLYMEYEFQ